MHWSALMATAYSHHPLCGVLPSRLVRRFSNQGKRRENAPSLREQERKLFLSHYPASCLSFRPFFK
jgi:hypothetical protein